MSESSLSPRAGRRFFLKEAAAIITGAIAMVVPFLSGVGVLMNPLRRKAGHGDFVKVTSLAALNEDGVPRRFSILASQTDAWNRSPDVPIGAVYLRRTGPRVVEAFNVVCPHAGCFVDYVADKRGYVCPCHNSLFALDGRVAGAKSPSPRGLDSLPVEIREGDEIWVRYQNFRAGEKEKVPV